MSTEVVSTPAAAPTPRRAGRTGLLYRGVLTKELRDRGPTALVVGFGVGLMAVFALQVYSGFAEQATELFEGLPAALTGMIGADVSAGAAGIVLGELFGLIAPIAVVAFAVSAGAGAIAGEERDRTLGLLLANPVSRRQVLAGKATGLTVLVIVIAALTWLGVLTAGAISGTDVDAGSIAAAAGHLAALGLAFGMVALAIGAATGNHPVAAGSTAAVATVSYLSASLLPLAEMDGWARISPWFYYNGSEPLSHGLDGPHLLVLLAIAAVALLTGLAAVTRRDLKG